VLQGGKGNQILLGLEIVFDLQIHDRADPGEGICKGGEKRFVPMTDDRDSYRLN
jgi:hypothetical protein